MKGIEKYKKKSKESFNNQAITYDIDKNGAHARALYSELIKKLNTIDYKSILDIGCGTGAILSLIVNNKRNIQAYGLDISEEMLSRAKKKLNKDVEFTVGDSENMPYSNNKFDVVICTDSFHHYPNPLNVLNEIYRVLEKGGKLIICDYWANFPKRQILNLFIPFSKDGDVRVYSEKEIINLLQQSNFKKIQWERINKNSYMIIGVK